MGTAIMVLPQLDLMHLSTFHAQTSLSYICFLSLTVLHVCRSFCKVLTCELFACTMYILNEILICFTCLEEWCAYYGYVVNKVYQLTSALWVKSSLLCSLTAQKWGHCLLTIDCTKLASNYIILRTPVLEQWHFRLPFQL